MSDAVLITLIICATLLAIVVLAVISGSNKDKDPDNKHGSGSHGLD